MNFPEFAVTGAFLALPLVVGGIVHMIAVKADILKPLKIPICQSAFGANKTWRGFVIMPVTCTLGVFLAFMVQDLLTPLLQVKFAKESLWFLGPMLGIGYMATELPNSFLKRRLGIAPGTNTNGRYKWLFVFLDQVDSGFGCSVVYYALLAVPIIYLVAFLSVGPLIHLVVNMGLFSLGLKRQKF
ncbi:MAG: CDP-archaeol synthase [Oligoflexia bacterium]|nr:CDP-archaeol synthase [Oligoflexia bacterium]